MSESIEALLKPAMLRPGPRAARPEADFTVVPAPASIEATGLSLTFLVELAAKLMLRRGTLTLHDLTQRLKLPRSVMESVIDFMRKERLCEVLSTGSTGANTAYTLTDGGRRRASEYVTRCHYAGPAPVPLQQYVNQVRAQSVRSVRTDLSALQAAFKDAVVDKQLFETMGAAINSGRPLLLYGPAGTGKTYLAERLGRALPGPMLVPYAIEVDEEVIQMFDPTVHVPVPEEEPVDLLERVQRDERWVKVMRPAVLVGGELNLAQLDLQFDELTRFYIAPPQLKANGGVLVVDDFGRQQVAPDALLNRWIVPLDRKVDYLALHTGKRFQVPFDQVTIFSSNLGLDQIGDAAFLRRLGYKLFVGPADAAGYEQIFRIACTRSGVPYSAEALQFLMRQLHAPSGIPLVAHIPNDLLTMIRDMGNYHGVEPRATPEALALAWECFFGRRDDTPEKGEHGVLQ